MPNRSELGKACPAAQPGLGVGAARRLRQFSPTLLAGAGLLCLGCRSDSPLKEQSELELRRSVIEAATRELADARSQPGRVETAREADVARLNIRPDILEELTKMGGPDSYQGVAPPIGLDLLGMSSRTATVGLERCVRSAVNNNLAVQFARLGPAVSEAQLQAAEAAFDWTVFSNLNYASNDAPRVSTGTGTVATSPPTDETQTISGNVGLRRQLVGGGRFTVQSDVSNTDNPTPGQTSEPNPASQASLTLQWDQPLLRNFGSDVNRSEIRLARNAERGAIQTLKRDLMRTVTETERVYWTLVAAHSELNILQRLLDRGEKVRDQLKQRAEIDANSAQIADAIARVERRRTDVLRAQTRLRGVSDQLKALMNEADLPVGSEVVLVPADRAVDAPLQFSLLQCLTTAVQNRPEVQQAVLAIDDASIRQVVANNQRLPDLNLRLQSRFSAISGDVEEAYGDQFSGNFVDYIVGVVFEAPVGNRRPEAEYRRRRLERMQAILSYRNGVQQVASDCKSALNRVVLNHSLIGQTRVSRVAAAEVLRVLEVEKLQGEGFTVERLNIELNNQESLAGAEREEIQALTDYNAAIAEVFGAMGTTLERNNIQFVVPGVEDDPGLLGPAPTAEYPGP